MMDLHLRHLLQGSLLSIALLLLMACSTTGSEQTPIATTSTDTVMAEVAIPAPAEARDKPRNNRRNAKPRPTAPPASVPPQQQASVEQANRLLQQGNREQAAQMYHQAAFSFPSPERERLLLQAAEITASLGNNVLTERYLAQVPASSLQGELRARYQYIKALSALQSQQPTSALAHLPRDMAGLPSALREKIWLVRQRALAQGGIAPAWMQAEARQQNLAPPQVPAQRPQALTPQTSAPQAAITPPIQARPVPSALPPIQQLAVLLPQTGSLAGVSQEIYQGIRDAQQNYGANKQSKRFDTNPETVLDRYQQAVAEGADLIVGPLDRESLKVLIDHPQPLSTPILSLNYETSKPSPAQMYQFGLSPEDEAKQIARTALSKGQGTAIVMVPDSNWGQRLAESFIQAYHTQGGQVLIHSAYPNAVTGDYLQRVQNALSNGRNAQMVFLAASPSQARLIYPLLRAQAPNLPIYATSHIYSGRPEPAQNSDLDGIIYTEIPMLLDHTQATRITELRFPRLYALGLDAVLISQNLPRLMQYQAINGQTGQIRLESNRHISRTLNLATFDRGHARRLE